MRALVWAAVSLVAGAVNLVGPAYADSDLVVTWSETSRFNPDLETYSFHVEDTGAGDSKARWGGSGAYVDITHSGDVALPFPAAFVDGSWTVVVYRCNPTCAVVATSPVVEVRRSLTIFGGLERNAYGPTDSIRGNFNAFPQDVAVTLGWTIARLGHPEAVVADGAAQLAPGSSLVAFEGIPSLGSGNYEIDIDASVDHPDFGHIEGMMTNSFVVDGDPPVVSWGKASDTEVFPERDDYKDYVSFRVKESEALFTADVIVLDQAGDEVDRSHADVNDLSDYGLIFSGRRSGGGAALPEGLYRLRLAVEDRFGNRSLSVLSPPVRVDRRRLKNLTFTRHVKPAAALIDKSVGKCSTLAKPSSRGGTGSLGYFSQTRCRRDAESGVGTVSGIQVPKLADVEPTYYKSVRVTMLGGGANGAQRSYINSGLYRLRGKKVEPYVVNTFGGNYGRHVLKQSDADFFVLDQRTRPYVLWFSGLTAGSRYDVQEYIVSVSYRDLVYP